MKTEYIIGLGVLAFLLLRPRMTQAGGRSNPLAPMTPPSANIAAPGIPTTPFQNLPGVVVPGPTDDTMRMATPSGQTVIGPGGNLIIVAPPRQTYAPGYLWTNGPLGIGYYMTTAPVVYEPVSY